MAWNMLLSQDLEEPASALCWGQVGPEQGHQQAPPPQRPQQVLSFDSPGIRQLQLILLKVALILGIEIHVNVEFQGLVQPPADQDNEREWGRWRRVRGEARRDQCRE